MMPEGLSEKEKWEWIAAETKLHGLPKRGRPKKGEKSVTWADLGITRQEAYLWRRLAEIGEPAFSAFMEKCLQESIASKNTRKPSRRRILVHFGKINVASDDIFENTDIGYLADTMLQWAGPALKFLTAKQLNYLARSLLFKLRSMATKRELTD